MHELRELETVDQFAPEIDIRPDGQVSDERKVLIHGFDSPCARLRRRREINACSVELDGASIGTEDAADNPYQSGFSRAVVTNEPGDLADAKINRDVLQGDHRTEALADGVCAEHRVWHSRLPHRLVSLNFQQLL